MQVCVCERVEGGTRKKMEDVTMLGGLSRNDPKWRAGPRGLNQGIGKEEENGTQSKVQQSGYWTLV